jgi:SAM-dependent methyltransferase
MCLGSFLPACYDGPPAKRNRMDQEILQNLQIAYDLAAETRDRQTRAKWKTMERDRFLPLLIERRFTRLLEIGAGTGMDGLFFKRNSLQVHCIDISQENVTRCRKKGLSAEVMDCTKMSFSSAMFDAAYALNSLLHIPHTDFEGVLKQISAVLIPKGLVYLGQYGGTESEGIWDDDPYRPKRFFSFLTDSQLQEISKRYFRVIEFRTIQLENIGSLHFQSLVMEKMEFPS